MIRNLIKIFIIFGSILFYVSSERVGLLDDLVNSYRSGILISSKCDNDMNILKKGLRDGDVWAVKLLDASSHAGSAFVWGNNYWLGSRHACELINDPIRIHLSNYIPKNHMENLTDLTSPMRVKYKVVYIKHSAQWQFDIKTFEKTIIHLGFCLPKSCTNQDVYIIALRMLNEKKFEKSELLDDAAQIIGVKTPEMSEKLFLKPYSIILGCIVLVNSALIIFSNIFFPLKKHGKNQNNFVMKNDSKKKKNFGLLEQFFYCFSLKKNYEIITTHSVNKDSIAVVHGIRAIGIIWIITGHLFFYTLGTVDNIKMLFTLAEIWYYQPMFCVAMIVDSFFVISGLLLSYLFFENEKKKSSGNLVTKFLKAVVYRYLRLTPSYAVVILLTTFFTSLLQDISPFWIIERNDLLCPKYWWRNILYINNFFPISDMCMSWSWFLSADFQCFTLSTLYLLITLKQKVIGISLFIVTFIASTALTGYYGYTMNYSLSLDMQYQTIDYLYTPTVTRIGAYFVGIFAGWYLSHTERKWTVQNKYLILGWTFAPMLNMLMIFGSTKKNISPIVAALYTGFGRVAWAIGISWIIVACTMGNGWLVTSVLSGKSLLPFSRMSYTLYLLNPLIISLVTLSTEVAIHFDYFSLLITTLGYITFIFVCSFVFMLFFENPFVRLTGMIRK